MVGVFQKEILRQTLIYNRLNNILEHVSDILKSNFFVLKKIKLLCIENWAWLLKLEYEGYHRLENPTSCFRKVKCELLRSKVWIWIVKKKIMEFQHNKILTLLNIHEIKTKNKQNLD